MIKKHINKKKLIFMGASIFVIMSFLCFLYYQSAFFLTAKMRHHAVKNSMITISEITNFKWDTLYVLDSYSDGSELGEYGIDYIFNSLASDLVYHIVFCKDKKVVKKLTISSEYLFESDNSVYPMIVYPKSEFECYISEYDQVILRQVS